ncbi:Hypothetical predicted protein, partial [Marmota monax]
MDDPMNGDVCSLFDYSQMKWAEWDEDDDESLDKSKKVEGDDSLFTDPPREEEDVQPSSSVSSHMDQLESQEPGTAKSSPVSALQSEEGDMPSDKEGTSRMNFRGFFHWLRKRVVSSLPGRKRGERASK